MKNRLTRKQFIKAKTNLLAFMIHRKLLPEEYRKELTMEKTLEVFPKVSYYKNQQGEVRVGLSLRGIKKLVKKHPYVSPSEVMTYFNASPK